MFAECMQVVGEVRRGVEGCRVVVAEDTAGAGEGVLVEGVRLLVLTQPAEVVGEVGGGAQGVGVVVTQHAPVAVEGVLVEGAGVLVVAEPAQGGSQVVR